MIDLGNGTPIVLIPGIQGRWEWMRPAVETLATRGRAVSFSLAGEAGSGVPFDESRGFDTLLDQLDAVLDRAGLETAALCGVSFGGLVALRYAARHPERTRALVLVSTPGPGWSLPDRTRRYMRHPHLLLPLFCLDASRRAWQELRRTFPTRRQAVDSALRGVRPLLRARTSLAHARQRAELAVRSARGLPRECSRISVPTLVVTGDAELDQIVPAVTTLEFVRLVKGATVARLEGTGHLGIVTRPERFADLVAGFATEHGNAESGHDAPPNGLRRSFAGGVWA